MKNRKITSLSLSSPWILSFLLFWAVPLIYSFVIGFTDYKLLHEYSWIGLQNYKDLLSDEKFISSIKNTFIFVIGTIPITTVLALFFAILINKNIRFRALFRSSYFLPSITSMVVVALIFTNLLSRGGYISVLASMVGISIPENGFLFDSSTALYAIMGMDIWMSVGYYMLIFLAGLQSIPKELYEVGDVYGASKTRQFFTITLPLLRPVALFVIVINSIKSFQVFVEIFVMTKGKFDTSTMVYFIYDTGLRTSFELGYASAAAYILFVIIGLFSLIQFFLLRRKEALW